MIKSLYGPFQKWAERGSVYLLSDTHFDDVDCKFMDPDWISPEEQVEKINSVVRKNDTFVCLGDVGNPKYISEIKAGRKVLILGNHDKRGQLESYFDALYSGPLFISDRILLSYEPVYGLPWTLNIHGHDHSGMEKYMEGCKHLNLAANMCGYTPVNLGALIKQGILSDINDIHRMCIDEASKRKAK